MRKWHFSVLVVTVFSILVLTTICWSAAKPSKENNVKGGKVKQTSAKNSVDKLSEADYKAACKEIPVGELTKNADGKKGQLVKVTGQIIVFEEARGNDVITRLILSVKDDSNTLPSGKLPVYARYYGTTDSFINDTVTIYGRFYGNDVYQSAQIQKKTLPRVDAKYIVK